MITAWQYGRLAKLPGVTPTFTFSPAQLSTRMRKAAQKMVRERLLRGGWQCESKRVAKIVMDAFAVPYSRDGVGHNYIKTTGLPSEVREKIADLLRADVAAKLLDSACTPDRVNYIQTDARGQIQDLLNPGPGKRLAISFYSRTFYNRALDVVARHNIEASSLLAEQAKRAAAVLDDPTFLMNIPVTQDTY